MIIIYFIIDYIVMLLWPLNTYFIIFDIDKNKVFNVFMIGIIFDVLYRKLLLFTSFLLIIYVFVKKLEIKKKYRLVLNIILYLFILIFANII